jgi:hypothetical protein
MGAWFWKRMSTGGTWLARAYALGVTVLVIAPSSIALWFSGYPCPMASKLKTS